LAVFPSETARPKCLHGGGDGSILRAAAARTAIAFIGRCRPFGPAVSARKRLFQASLGAGRPFQGFLRGGTAQKRLDPNGHLSKQVMMWFVPQPPAPLRHRLARADILVQSFLSRSSPKMYNDTAICHPPAEPHQAILNLVHAKLKYAYFPLSRNFISFRKYRRDLRHLSHNFIKYCRRHLHIA
jgi:hypothetical protein